MRCPWCGSEPVRITGNHWECGWCGDSGFLRRRSVPTQKTVQVKLSFSLSYHVDLAESWTDLKKALGQLMPDQSLPAQLLGRVLLHSISEGIRSAAAGLEKQKGEELRAFLYHTPDLNLGENIEAVLTQVEKGVLFSEEGALSETECGTFWREIIAAHVEDYYNRDTPDGLYELLDELGSAYAYFEGRKGEEMGRGQDYQNARQDAYDAHCMEKALLHPDGERAKGLLAKGEFPDYEDICREILLVDYPEEVPHESAQALDELSWENILDEVFSRDGAKGVEMWRSLLDLAEPVLKTDLETAKKLLPNWNWIDFSEPKQALPILCALKDARFASQIFQSASVGKLQLDVLEACRDNGQEELGKQCLELVRKNPYLDADWEKRLQHIFYPAVSGQKTKPRTHGARRPPEDPKPDDGTVFHYCSVQIEGVRRSYAYLTGGLPLKVGDWVELPFGKDDAPRKGQVKAIMDCTRTVAPWPPEQTKTVIQIIAAPEGEQTTETAAPNVEQHIAPPEGVAEQPKEVEEPEKTEGPAVPEQSAEPKAPEVPSQPVEPVAPNEPDKGEEPPPPPKKSVIQQKPVRPKKPFPMKEFVKALLAVAVVAGVAIAFLTHEKRQAAAYEEALDALSRGKYISAEQSFSDLSGYRDAEPLSVYCKYMNIYQNATEYEGGLWELSKIRLRYNMDLQKQVDALIFRVERYSAAEKAADAAKKEAQRKEQYSGKLPVDGMPTSSLKYTSLGSPTKTEKCRFYDDMDTYRRYKILTWSNDEGQIVATCHSQQKRGETEETISSFTYHDPPIGRPDSAPPLVPPFGPSDSSGHTGSIRDDYDTPEDLWEENQDWYEDEDEAWDEWYDG